MCQCAGQALQVSQLVGFKGQGPGDGRLKGQAVQGWVDDCSPAAESSVDATLTFAMQNRASPACRLELVPSPNTPSPEIAYCCRLVYSARIFSFTCESYHEAALLQNRVEHLIFDHPPSVRKRHGRRAKQRLAILRPPVALGQIEPAGKHALNLTFVRELLYDRSGR